MKGGSVYPDWRLKSLYGERLAACLQTNASKAPTEAKDEFRQTLP
jgi:hypothetical protein